MFWGMSPLWWPIGFRVPCCLALGLKWPPAVLKSGASHLGFWWMWTACSPKGRFLRLTFMTTSPFLPDRKVALPASSPALVLMGTVMAFLALARAGTARRLRVIAAVVRVRRMGFFS